MGRPEDLLDEIPGWQVGMGVTPYLTVNGVGMLFYRFCFWFINCQIVKFGNAEKIRWINRLFDYAQICSMCRIIMDRVRHHFSCFWVLY